jgi:hypothetical protein
MDNPGPAVVQFNPIFPRKKVRQAPSAAGLGACTQGERRNRASRVWSIAPGVEVSAGHRNRPASGRCSQVGPGRATDNLTRPQVQRAICGLRIRGTAQCQSALPGIGASGRRVGPGAVLNLGLLSCGMCFGFRTSCFGFEARAPGAEWPSNHQPPTQGAEAGPQQRL